MNSNSNMGFAANPELAKEVAKRTKALQSPKERSDRARAAVNARWKKEKSNDTKQP